MNRIIKFRGKSIQSGEWVYGYYVKTDEGSRIIELDLTDEDIAVDFDDDGGYKPEKQFVTCCWQVNPATVGQFTGLRDKKRTDEYPEGQEIYEGDIVEFSSACFPTSLILGHKRIGEVFFKIAGSIDYCFRCTKDGNFGLNSNDVSCYEILGNIHSKPELIEKEESNNQNQNYRRRENGYR